MIRFSHTLFALPFALLAAVMAWNAIRTRCRRCRGDGASWREFWFAWSRRAVPRWPSIGWRIERIDAKNPRTAARHLPSGQLSRSSVAVFAVACSVLFVAGTLLFLPNRLPMLLSLPVLAFLLAYSYTKRFTSLAHFWLGAALMLAPVSAWIAIRGQTRAADRPICCRPLCWAGPCCFGLLVSTSSTPARMKSSIGEAGLASVPARFGVPASAADRGAVSCGDDRPTGAGARGL